MTLTDRNITPYLALALLAVPLFFLNICSLHCWGDDFSQYIKEAQNIAQGKPYYLSNYVFNRYNPVYAPPQYPPGFPLMLAPVIKIWGLSFTALNYFNSVIMAAVMFALYAFFRKYAGMVASICLAVLVVYSSFLLDLKRNVLADVPSLLFCTLYLALRQTKTYSWRRIISLILLACAAIQTRSQCVFLLAAEAIMFVADLFKSRFAFASSVKLVVNKYPSVFILAGVTVLNLLLSKVIFPTPLSTGDFYYSFLRNALQGHILEFIGQHLGYVFATFKTYFHYDADDGFAQALITIGEAGAVVLSVSGFFIKCRKGLAIEDVFFFVMCMLILHYPVRDARYFLPAVPVLYLYCYISLRSLVPSIAGIYTRYVGVALTAAYLLAGSALFKKIAQGDIPGGIPGPQHKAAFSFITHHVKDNEIIAFTKPRALTLFTDRKTISMSWQSSLQENKKILDSFGVKYMLIIDGFEDGMFKDYLRDAQHPIDSVRFQDVYTLYTLR